MEFFFLEGKKNTKAFLKNDYTLGKREANLLKQVGEARTQTP